MNDNLAQLLIDIAETKDLEKKWRSDSYSVLKQYDMESFSMKKILSSAGNSLNVILSKEWPRPTPGSPA